MIFMSIPQSTENCINMYLDVTKNTVLNTQHDAVFKLTMHVLNI